MLARLGDRPTPPENARRLLLVPYFAAGLIACAVALFDRLNTGDAIGGAIREAFLANAVLLIMPRWLSGTASAAPIILRDLRWIFAATVVFVAFALALRRGLRA